MGNGMRSKRQEQGYGNGDESRMEADVRWGEEGEEG